MTQETTSGAARQLAPHDQQTIEAIRRRVDAPWLTPRVGRERYREDVRFLLDRIEELESR